MKQNTKQLCEALPYAAPSCKIYTSPSVMVYKTRAHGVLCQSPQFGSANAAGQEIETEEEYNY